MQISVTWTLDRRTDPSPAFNQWGTRRAPDRRMSGRWYEVDGRWLGLQATVYLNLSWLQLLSMPALLPPPHRYSLDVKAYLQNYNWQTLSLHTFTLWFHTQVNLWGLASSVFLIRPWGGGWGGWWARLASLPFSPLIILRYKCVHHLKRKRKITQRSECVLVCSLSG